jgi:predicted ATPase/class 3 adenylate cyclase
MTQLPTGTVTFLFTDLEGSTRLWEAHPEAMEDAIAEHDALLRDAVETHRGILFAEMGDGIAAAFPSAVDAITAALDAQLRLATHEWTGIGSLRARMGLYAGAGEIRSDGHYVNQPLNRCARLMASAHGGQVVISETVEVLVRGSLPVGTTVIDLGEHRLRDVTQPVHVFELVHPDLPRLFPPLRSLDALPGSLPVELTSFVGRERDLQCAISAMDRTRVLTLTGVGGVGKTRLALRVATEAFPNYRDGAWLCELAGVRNPDAVPDTAAATFGIQPRQGRTPAEALLEFLQAKEALLVLDNCEHLLKPIAELVSTITRACSNVHVLATSRERLGVAGEQVLAVSPLDVAETAADLDTFKRCDAARLFVERAQAVKQDFAISSGNAAAVAQICRHLDGIPLAIELAAARVAMLTPEELARRLDERFRLLTGGSDPIAEHHRTLRATIDWSYELLATTEKLLLDRLSVFAGGFTLEAAETVNAGDDSGLDTFEPLAALVARSLVVAETEGPATRYRLLETIRQYGQEHLDASGDAARIRTRHAGYFTTFAETAVMHLAGHDEIEWLRRLTRELDNLRCALTWAIDSEDADTALRLLAVCSRPNAVDSDVGFALPAPAAAVLKLPGAEDNPAFPDAHIAAAWYASNRGDQDLAEQYCDRALAAQERLHTEANPSLWGIRGAIAIANGRIDEWIEHSEQQVASARKVHDDVALVWGLTGSALGRALLGDVAEAIPRSEEALAVAEGLGNPRSSAWARMNAGFVLGDSDPERALALLREAAELAAPLGRSQVATAWGMATDVAASHGDRREALQLAAKAIDAWRWNGYRPGLGLGVRYVGDMLAADEPEAAAILYAAADTMGSAEVVGGHLADLHEHGVASVQTSLSELRRGELRAEGLAMDEDQVVAYVHTAITRILTSGT